MAFRLSLLPEAPTSSARENAMSSRPGDPPGHVTTARHAPSSGSTSASVRAKRVGRKAEEEDAFASTADFTKREKMTPSSPAPGMFPAGMGVVRAGPQALRFFP